MRLWVSLAVALLVVERDPDGESVGEGEAVTLPVGLGVPEGVELAEDEGEPDGVVVGLGVGEGVKMGRGPLVGATLWEGQGPKRGNAGVPCALPHWPSSACLDLIRPQMGSGQR